jgi:hypothetical protein
MWFLYVISAVGMSLGAGAFASAEVDMKTRDQIKAESPASRAEQSATTERSLRRMFQIDQSRFPRPRLGRTAQIPASLVEEAIIAGSNIPRDVIFEIDRSGNISSRLSGQSKLNEDHFTSTLGISRENGLDMNRIPKPGEGGSNRRRQ